MKYRVGRKQKRAILDEKGLEIALFANGYEKFAEITCEVLNQITMNKSQDYGFVEQYADMKAKEAYDAGAISMMNSIGERSKPFMSYESYKESKNKHIH